MNIKRRALLTICVPIWRGREDRVCSEWEDGEIRKWFGTFAAARSFEVSNQISNIKNIVQHFPFT